VGSLRVGSVYAFTFAPVCSDQGLEGTTLIVVELKLSATQIAACNLFIATWFDLLNRIRLKSSSTGHGIQYFQYLTNEAVQMGTPPADLCVLFFALLFILYG